MGLLQSKNQRLISAHLTVMGQQLQTIHSINEIDDIVQQQIKRFKNELSQNTRKHPKLLKTFEIQAKLLGAVTRYSMKCASCVDSDEDDDGSQINVEKLSEYLDEFKEELLAIDNLSASKRKQLEKKIAFRKNQMIQHFSST